MHIRVEGLDELRRGLRNIDNDLGKALGKKNRSVGAFVVSEADKKRRGLQGRFPSYGSKVMKVKPSANQRRVMVTVSPPAAEWGAINHPVFGREMSQARFRRQVWPGRNSDGWMVRPTVAEKETEIAKQYLDAVAELAYEVIGR